MKTFLPDAVTLEVKWRGNDLPCKLNLLRGVDIPVASGNLDLASLQQKYIDLELDEMRDHKEYGQTLFNFLFPPGLREKFFQLVGEAGERGVRITLNIDPDIPGMHTIPWERMYFPQSNQLFPLATEPSFVFSRLLKTSNPEATPKTRGCFRTLFALANPLPGTLHFNEAVEREKMEAVFKSSPRMAKPIEIPKPVTLEAVLTYLEEAEEGFDILYFSGHGSWKPSIQTEGQKTINDPSEVSLIFEKTDGSPDKVTLDRFMERLNRTIQKKRLPRLIFLSACHTAIKEKTREALLGFGPTLVEAGCPAVICMQESIEDPIAQAFACKFFYELFENGCIDEAVNQARAALFEHDSWQWAIPVLFMNTRDGMLFWPKERFKELLSEPYKYLKPFKREDAEFFKGRDSEIESIKQAVNNQKLTVVRGRDGIGLTSLIEAGVRPALDIDNTLVVVISEYTDLASEIRSGLLASRLHIYLPFEGSDSPRKVLEEAISSSLRSGVNCIILVLDQFERVFRLPPEQNEQIRDQVVDLLDQLEILRVILVVHDNWRDALELWEEKLPDLDVRPIKIGPLLSGQVVDVINTPLLTNRFEVTQIDDTLSKSVIPEDLARLYEEVQGGAVDRQPYSILLEAFAKPCEEAGGGNEEGKFNKNLPVDPGQLQIVCDWLYRQTEKSKKKKIESDLYNNAGRADGILARTMADTLEDKFGAEPDLRYDALTSMVGPGMDRWVELKKIAPKQLDRDKVVEICERLVKFELLDSYRTAGTTYYGFANQTVQRMAIEMGGNELRMQYQAEGEIERIWRMWLVTHLRSESLPTPASAGQPALSGSRALATVEQLRMLNETSGHLHPDNLQILLLLRSAVQHDEPVDLWLQWLNTAPDTLKMLRSFETDLSLFRQDGCEDAGVKQAASLLGLSRLQPLETLANRQEKFGRLAWSAVSNPQRANRCISALTLSSAFPNEFTKRLEEALDAWKSAPDRAALTAWRRAEVHGNLVDSGVTLSEGNGKGRGGSFWTWAWRFGRRLLRHGRRLTAMLVGSAIGAGLVLGGWYFLLFLLARSYLTGPSLPLYAFLGAMLGAVTALGVGLAEPMLLEDSREPELHPPQWRQPLRYTWLPDCLGVVLATLAFGITHALLVIIVSFPSSPQWGMIPMGFIAGLGISLGLYGQPRVGLKLGWHGWLPRLAVAALLVAATQFVPCLAGKDWNGTNFTFSAGHFQALYMQNDWIKSFFAENACQSGWSLQGLLSTLNAAVLGALLTFSCAFGMDSALRKLMEWRQRDKNDSKGEK